MNDIEDTAFDLVSIMYSKQAMLSLGYETVGLLSPTDMSFEEYCWRAMPDDYENCGGYIP